ncbi:MAG: hypothetical protein KDM63_11070, partial [Verrucomicrobiae bacterium]|nr:hypothetical protein [Verrucomicrobiae bacterium]
EAEAKKETYQIPTVMTVTVTPTTAKRRTKVTVTARLTRLDNGTGVGSAGINFFFGDPTYPNQALRTSLYTNSQGVASFTFTISDWSKKGHNVVLAEFLGNNRFAQPLPYASLTVSTPR